MAPSNPSKAPKRKELPRSESTDDSSSPSGRATKYAKKLDARKIPTRYESSGDGSPGELSLRSFLGLQRKEIYALDKSVKKSKTVNATRAFQTVPRHMRRRAASHNVKVLPMRLRKRSVLELLHKWKGISNKAGKAGDAGKTDEAGKAQANEAKKRRPQTRRARLRADAAKKLSSLLAKQKRNQRAAALGEIEAGHEEAGGPASMDVDSGDGNRTSDKETEAALLPTRRGRPPTRQNVLSSAPMGRNSSRFRQRQRDKIWLPTHKWLVKRATMTTPSTLWGFVLPLHSSDKTYRDTHRSAAGFRGAVCWDTSYISTIRLHGKTGHVMQLLGTIVRFPPGDMARFQSGAEFLRGLLIIPTTSFGPKECGDVVILSNPLDPSDSGKRREVLLRTHPASFQGLWDGLLQTIDKYRLKASIEDLRFEVGSIDVLGPGSVEALLGVLKPFYAEDSAQEQPHARYFQRLAGVTDASALPGQAVLSFCVQDPRLTYPPKPYRRDASKQKDGVKQEDGVKYEDEDDDIMNIELLENLAYWPAGANMRPSKLFDKYARHKAGCLPSQGALNRRKGSQKMPGAPLKVTAADPPIPIILTCSSTAGQYNNSGKSGLVLPQPGWTLLVPWKCVMPFWYSLMHYPLSSGGNPHFRGVDEERQVALENTVPWFPGDYPASPGGLLWELEQRMGRENRWRHLPRGKRTSWTTLDLGAGRKGEVGSPFGCDWEYLCGLEKREPTKTDAGVMFFPKLADLGDPESSYTTSVHFTEHPLHKLKRVSAAAFRAVISASPTPDRPFGRCDLITVSIKMFTTGVPLPGARVYRLPAAARPAATQVEVPSTPQVRPAQITVPATNPPSCNDSDSEDKIRELPHNLRAQWLNVMPGLWNRKLHNWNMPAVPPRPKRMPRGADMATRKRLTAQSLLTTPLAYPRPDPADAGGRPLVPDAETDLLGFVTSGSYNLRFARGVGIAHLAADRTAESMRRAMMRDWPPSSTKRLSLESRLCIIRNVGETTSNLAEWTLI